MSVRVSDLANSTTSNTPAAFEFCDGEWYAVDGQGLPYLCLPAIRQTGPELRLSGYAQLWLQHRPWPLWRLGNLLSTARFWLWRACGGRWE